MITEILIPLYIKNKNNRIYTKETLEDPVKILNLNNIIYGQIDYPDYTHNIDLSNISHSISNIRFSNNNLIGDITILTTEKGKLLQSMINSGQEFSFRPRSTGSVSKDGVVFIDKLISFDAIPLEEDAWYNIRVQRKRKLEKLYDIQNRNNR